MKCPSCGNEIPDGSVFCPQCGNKCADTNQIRCPVCQNVVPPDSPFCPNCGATLLTTDERKKAFKKVKKQNIQKHIIIKIKKFVENWRSAFIPVLIVAIILLIGGVYVYTRDSNKTTPDTNINTNHTKQSPQQSDKKQKTADSDLALGPVFVGETWSDVQRDLGQPNSNSTEPPNYTRYKYDDMEVIVENKNNTVQALVSKNSSVSTKRGIHQGDSLTDVFNAYGTDYKKSDYGEQTYYEYEYKTKDGSPALLRFAINNNDKVDYISIRTITNDINNARKAFLDYHKAISDHHFKEAYSYFTDNCRQSIGDYSSYALGYQDTLSSSVSNVKVVDSSPSKVKFMYTLKARDRIPVSSRSKTQTFNGEVTMIQDNGKWYIDSMSAQKTDEHIN